jgi:hypothetical protein
MVPCTELFFFIFFRPYFFIISWWRTSTALRPGLPIDGPARGANGAPQCGPGPGVLLACRIGSGRPSPGLDV